MNSKQKHRLLVATVILLLIINISALSTIIFHNYAVKNKFNKEELLKQETQQRGMNYYFRNELKLTNEQFEAFQKVNNTYFIKSQNIAYNLHTNRILLLEEIAKENPNLNKLDRIAKEIGNLHYELKNNTINHFMELKETCNDEQQVKLQQFFMKLIEDQDQGQFRRRDGYRREGNGKNRRQRPSRSNR